MIQDPITPKIAVRSDSRLGLDLIIDIPLALLSFIWFKLIKLIVSLIYGLGLMLNRKLLNNWQLFSDKTLQIPITLPVVMTKGPRWNPHAIVVSVGPFRAKKKISIDLNALKRSASSWSVVIYRYPSYQTISYVSASDILDPAITKQNNQDAIDQVHFEWYDLTCESGLYCLGLRLFEVGDILDLPEVQSDGQTGIPATKIPSARPSYQDFKKYHNWFYLSLHYYIFTILRLQPWLPDSLIRHEYLPVGNPDTTFFYDYLRHGDRLYIQIDPTLLEDHYVYWTTYTRSSLPLDYGSVNKTKPTHTTTAMPQDGFYLIRVRPQHKQAIAVNQTLIQLKVKNEKV